MRAAVRQDFTYFASAEFYINMFAAAGFPEVSRESGLSDELIDSFTFYGDQNAIASSIQGLFDDGASEVYASIVTPSPRRHSFQAAHRGRAERDQQEPVAEPG